MTNFAIGDTAFLLDKPQSIRGDFLWVLPFVDVADDGTETDTDLTDCDFVMEIFEQDGTTQKMLLNVGEGIEVSGSTVSILIENSDFSAWTKGCKYPYYLTMTNADSFTKCLFEGKFIPT